MTRKRIAIVAAGLFLLALGLPLLAGGTSAELDDEAMASLRGGMAPTTYCNPHPSCTGTTVYCSDAVPGNDVGNPCTPASAIIYYNPEHCSELSNDRACGETSTVQVYCYTVTYCVTAFSGTTKYCTAGLAVNQQIQVTTDTTRCRNLFLVESGPLGP